MTEPALLSRERALVRDLLAAAAARTREEPAAVAELRQRLEQAEQAFAEAAAGADRALSDEQLDADGELQAARVGAEQQFRQSEQEARRQSEEARQAANKRYNSGKEASEAAYKEACWTIGAVLEGAKTDATSRLRELHARLVDDVEAVGKLREEGHKLVESWDQPVEELEAEADASASMTDVKAAPRELSQVKADAEALVALLKSLTAPKLRRPLPFGIFAVLVWLILCPLGWLVGSLVGVTDKPVQLAFLGIAAGTLLTGVAAMIAYMVMTRHTRNSARALFLPLCRLALEADATKGVLDESYKTEYSEAVRVAKNKHNDEVRQAHAKLNDKRTTIKKQLDQALPPVEDRLRQRLAAAQEARETALRTAEQHYQVRREEARKRHEKETNRLREAHGKRLEEIHAAHHKRWDRLAEAWGKAVGKALREADAITAEADHLYPPWDAPSWENFSLPADAPPVLRFGSLDVRMAELPGGLPEDEGLRGLTPEALRLPALGAFPEQSPLILRCGGEGHEQAVSALQAAVLRLLTALPAAKARLIILDPLGLGQNFAAFMHLADYDERLVTSRIWTESAHIEVRLADLTAHMENVIQKYLRNEFETINDYNAHAGEVAEPYRILVVANFPVNFSADAIRRLISIAQSGPRCGVYTVLSVDPRQPFPKGFDLADLERAGCSLVWEEGRFNWKDADFGRFPLSLEGPPEAALANRLLERVGESARDAHRVEVPFEYIAPAEDEWWKADSRGGLRVALGRAGATARQFFDLGKGTSQHALVAGKTGSGKSTLLHALITNMSLLYSPDEVELYLIDFKKGVEFKTYAAHQLPHARVIAIESEREFGLSVLQRLDAELRARGERFREVEAQDIKGYRQARPDAYMPRILLVVDEFQEFFTEDDRIAQDAAQLLDRIVRQGRAFGMHVFLGSQTLGGAYSLARSTIDQMAVRIALQCSEADAGLILNEDNSAARLLSRPGEAIYNDANGLIEGNHPFQVVWLPDTRREDYLERIREMARGRRLRAPGLPVIFEGNAPADVTKNNRLRDLLAAPPPAADGHRGATAWLGDALSINDQTAAAFKRQNGSHLMIVGQQEEAAQGMLTTAVISLAAQAGPGETPRFYVIDGRNAGPTSEGPLARLPELVHCPVRLAGWREAAAVMAEVSAELEARQKAPDAPAPSVYVILYALQRLRDMRKSDDDFGFMNKPDQAANPAQQLATLLREGPTLGMHVLFWCDNLNNLQRTLDRQGLREIGLRVVFQMGVADSSNLIDTPAASKLGMHRALLFSEEDGRLEKFRPYGLPPEEWLDEVRDRVRQTRRSTAPAPEAAGAAS
jgi:hypothetical protein